MAIRAVETKIPRPLVRPVPSAAVKVFPRWPSEAKVLKWRLRYCEEGAMGSGPAEDLLDTEVAIELELRGFTRELPLTGLSDGVRHFFKAQILTEEGWSSWSDPAECMVPSPTAPGKCAAVLATVKDATTATVRWSPPIDCASTTGKLTQYKIRAVSTWPLQSEEDLRLHCKEYSVDPTVESADPVGVYLVPNLECCVDYRFQVAAQNAGGWGEWSDPSEVINMPLPVPAAPPKPTLRRPTHHSAVIQWMHPNAGGSPIESFRFRYTCAPGGEPGCWTTDVTEIHDVPHNLSQYVVKGLLPGREYLFQVRAANKYGIGIWSESSVSMRTVEGQAPSKITNLTIPHIYESFITLRWPPVEDNGYEVTHHSVRYAFSPDMADPIELQDPEVGKDHSTGFETCSLRHLAKGKTYFFQVVAFNKMGMTDWSDPVEVHLASRAERQKALPPAPAQQAISAH